MEKEEAREIVESGMLRWEMLQEILSEAARLDDFSTIRNGWTRRQIRDICRRVINGRTGAITGVKGRRIAVNILIEFG